MPDQARHDEVRAATKWNRALAAWHRADAAIEAAAHSSDQHHYDRLGVRHDRALVRLLLTPIPDPAACPEQSRRALADKLDLAIAHQIWELTAGDSCLAFLQSDARRLASPT
jgi:hypothetical protein